MELGGAKIQCDTDDGVTPMPSRPLPIPEDAVCQAVAGGDRRRERHDTDDTDDEDIPGIDRLLALTDGVVAIALTLLVLQLQVPVDTALKADPNSARALWDALSIDGAELTSYLVSFVVIAQFWLVHHRILRSMRGHSEGLAWRNFGFLLALTLMPFTSDLIGRYGSNPVAITLFGINLVAISLSTQWIYLYAAKHDLMVDHARSAARRACREGARHPRPGHRQSFHRAGLD